MCKPKFEAGTLVKYRVGKQWRYNNVVDSYYNSEVGQRMYTLDDTVTLPVHKEDELLPVNHAEEAWLRQLVQNNKLLFGDTGYMYTKDGEVYGKR